MSKESTTYTETPVTDRGIKRAATSLKHLFQKNERTPETTFESADSIQYFNKKAADAAAGQFHFDPNASKAADFSSKETLSKSMFHGDKTKADNSYRLEQEKDRIHLEETLFATATHDAGRANAGGSSSEAESSSDTKGKDRATSPRLMDNNGNKADNTAASDNKDTEQEYTRSVTAPTIIANLTVEKK